MVRREARGRRYAMAFGVDEKPNTGAFVIVWDTVINDQPIDEDDDGETNIVLHECDRDLRDTDLCGARVIELACLYKIPISARDVYDLID